MQPDVLTDPSTASALDVPPPVLARSRTWTLVLIVLMAATSLALAAAVSAWLVPPYLGLMAGIVFPGRFRRRPAPTVAVGAGSSVSPCEVDEGPRAEVREDHAGPGPECVSDQAREPESSPAPVALKPKRGRGKKAKAVQAAVAPPVTWVRVGPGKYVRMEGPASTSEAARVADPPPELAITTAVAAEQGPEPDRGPECVPWPEAEATAGPESTRRGDGPDESPSAPGLAPAAAGLAPIDPPVVAPTGPTGDRLPGPWTDRGSLFGVWSRARPAAGPFVSAARTGNPPRRWSRGAGRRGTRVVAGLRQRRGRASGRSRAARRAYSPRSPPRRWSWLGRTKGF